MKKLFVGNLPYGANETDVQNLFADAGVTVDSVTVMRDRFTGQARGFGFVEINDDAAAQRAVDACHGKELMGRALVVNEARPMAPREGGGGAAVPALGTYPAGMNAGPTYSGLSFRARKSPAARYALIQLSSSRNSWTSPGKMSSSNSTFCARRASTSRSV